MIVRLTKKILNNLIRPHKVPRKILNKINYYYKYKNYNQNLFEKKQNDLFNHYGLDREKGIKKYISLLGTTRVGHRNRSEKIALSIGSSRDQTC